jgi:hypothetical protein
VLIKIFFDSWDIATIEYKETVRMLLLNGQKKFWELPSYLKAVFLVLSWMFGKIYQ